MLLLLRKLALEVAFDIFTTKRVPCFGQHDGIDHLIMRNLGGDKCPVFRQLLVDEFHFSAVFKCFDPLFVWHFCYPYSGKISVCREYTSFGARNRRWENDGLPLCLHPPKQRAELPQLAKFIVRTVQFGPAGPLFPSLCCIYREDE